MFDKSICFTNYFDTLLAKLEMVDKRGNMKSLRPLINGEFGEILGKFDKNFRDKIKQAD